MEQLKMSTTVNAPVAQVWSIIGAVGGVDQWSPIINSCTLSSSPDGGLQRTCSSDQGDLKEQILHLDHKNRKLAYVIVEQQFFPIDNLETHIYVHEVAGKTTIETEVSYQLRPNAPAQEIAQGIQNVYAASYAGIESVIEPNL